uniref:Uncharacterized protein n=1 Tax=Strigamia maritima TaxID=126957 RepID=T1J153_STRMM
MDETSRVVAAHVQRSLRLSYVMESCACCDKWSSSLMMSSSVRLPIWLPFAGVLRSAGARAVHALLVNLPVELVLDGQVQIFAVHAFVQVVFHTVFTAPTRQSQGDGTLPDVVPPGEQDVFGRIGHGLRLLADEFDGGSASRRSLLGCLSAVLCQGWHLLIQLMDYFWNF